MWVNDAIAELSDILSGRESIVISFLTIIPFLSRAFRIETCLLAARHPPFPPSPSNQAELFRRVISHPDEAFFSLGKSSSGRCLVEKAGARREKLRYLTSVR